jgi:carboxypeptidase Taq
MGNNFERLKVRWAEVTDLTYVTAVLSWDQETYMPPAGAQARSEQLATVSKLAHGMLSSAATGKLIKAAAQETDVANNAAKSATVRVANREYIRNKKLPSDFVAEFSRHRALSQQAWIRARRASDFKAFLPWLKKTIDFTRRAADYYGWREHPYDALLDGYEPGMTTATVRGVFAQLRDETVPLVQAIVAASDRVTDALLHGHFDKAAQEQFSKAVAAQCGFDMARGRLDYSTHPFCTNFSVNDVRMTTRVDESFFNTLFFSVLHEMGHGMYEQGIDPKFERTPLGASISLGIHESQSRMWENVVGRSRAFWKYFYPKLQTALPHFKNVPATVFYGAINRVQPSLVRIEADELTYNMHIFARFELELALLEGALKVKDLPEAWNTKYQSYLGLTPPSDALGCLQDIHWSIGLIGYFPTYTLGNVMSVQLYEAAKRAMPDLESQFARGEFSGLLSWLNKHVHAHGRRYLPQDLLKRATGHTLNATPYINYLKHKFGALYGI